MVSCILCQSILGRSSPTSSSNWGSYFLQMKKERAFKVFAYKDDKLIAEYLFALLKEAMIFELGMRKDGYTTKVERLWV